MQVEILEEKLSSDGFSGMKNDRLTVPDEVGKSWCSHGWAKDMADEVATGERNIAPVEINPKKLNHNSVVQEAK